jgi:hypothetical protein
MKIDSRMSLGDLLLEHAKQLSLISEPQRPVVQETIARGKARRKAARTRASERKAAGCVVFPDPRH